MPEIPNVFERLEHGKGEDYLTAALVFVLELLLGKGQEHALRHGALQILNDISGTEQFRIDDNLKFQLQPRLPRQRDPDLHPDIRISSSRNSLWIEAKYKAPVEEKQLKEYKNRMGHNDRLTLLTPVGHAIPESVSERIERGEINHVYWERIHEALGEIVITDPVDEYLAKSFRSYLEAKGLSIEKVSEGYHQKVWKWLAAASTLSVDERTGRRYSPPPWGSKPQMEASRQGSSGITWKNGCGVRCRN